MLFPTISEEMISPIKLPSASPNIHNMNTVEITSVQLKLIAHTP